VTACVHPTFASRTSSSPGHDRAAAAASARTARPDQAAVSNTPNSLIAARTIATPEVSACSPGTARQLPGRRLESRQCVARGDRSSSTGGVVTETTRSSLRDQWPRSRTGRVAAVLLRGRDEHAARAGPDSHRAESEHASVQALAASQLTIEPEQKSAPLRARCSNVAFPITRSALLRRPAADLEQELDLGLFPPLTWPLLRGSSTTASVAGDFCIGPTASNESAST
jgi:hypothetical protein